MNYNKILVNIGASVGLCLGMAQLTSHTGWKEIVLGIVSCVLANQLGLHQERPKDS